MFDNTKKINLSIVLPCYNPLANWADTIITSIQELQKRLPNVQLQLIIVNDGSKTTIAPESITAIKAIVNEFEYISYPKNRGKGYALRQGMLAVKHDLCIYTDIDFPYTTDSFIHLFERLQSRELDVIAGVRNQDYYKNVPYIRILISKTLRFLIRNFLNIKITDTQCGIKGFNNSGRITFLKTETNRYLFDLEFIFLSSNDKKLTISSIPVVLKPNIVFSKVNLKTLLIEGWSFLKLLFKSLFGNKK